MNNWCICWFFMHPLNAELNPICHLLALLGGANIFVISRLRVKTFGCVSAIASSSVATEWVKGKTIEGARKIKNTAIVEELSLPPVRVHCSVLAEEAIRSSIADYEKQQ